MPRGAWSSPPVTYPTAGTVYLVQVCKEHDPDPRRSMPLAALPAPCQSANVLEVALEVEGSAQ
jgi:hypothetical protein